MTLIKASVVQACTVSYSLPDTLFKLDKLTGIARKRDGSQLCVFPEALWVLWIYLGVEDSEFLAALEDTLVDRHSGR
jgi:hypothetical protein